MFTSIAVTQLVKLYEVSKAWFEPLVQRGALKLICRCVWQTEKDDDPLARQEKLAEFLTNLHVPSSKYLKRRRQAILDITDLCAEYEIHRIASAKKAAEAEKAAKEAKKAAEEEVFEEEGASVNGSFSSSPLPMSPLV